MADPISYSVWFERWPGDEPQCFIICSPASLARTKRHVRQRAAAAKRQAPAYRTRIVVQPNYDEK